MGLNNTRMKRGISHCCWPSGVSRNLKTCHRFILFLYRKVRYIITPYIPPYKDGFQHQQVKTDRTGDVFYLIVQAWLNSSS